jgi:hypothetical protein
MLEPLTLTVNLTVRAGGVGADSRPINELEGSLIIEWNEDRRGLNEIVLKINRLWLLINYPRDIMNRIEVTV